MDSQDQDLVLPFTVSGIVVHGFGRGHSLLGFPTANVSNSWEVKVTESGYGVYCGKVNVEGYPTKKGVISIGKNPTFENEKPTFEVHILDFSEDIYDAKITVELVYKIRPMMVFSSIQALIEQIQNDIQVARSKVIIDQQE